MVDSIDDPFSKPCATCGGIGIYKHEHTKGCFTEYDLETKRTFCPLPTSRRCDSCDGTGRRARPVRLMLRPDQPPLVCIDNGNPLVLFEIGNAYVAPPAPRNICLCVFGCQKKKGTLPTANVCVQEEQERIDAELLAVQSTSRKNRLCDCLAGEPCAKATLPAGKVCTLDADREGDQAPAAEPVVAPAFPVKKSVTIDITGKREGLAFELIRTLRFNARCASVPLPAAGPGLWEVTSASDVSTSIKDRHWCHSIDLDVVQAEADAPRAATAKDRDALRWVLRYRDGAKMPAEDVAVLEGLPGLIIVARSPVMLLVSATERVIHGAARWLVDWTFTPERAAMTPAVAVT